jgi:hypothetical protein
MMAKDPKDRFQSYDDLINALDGLQKRQESSGMLMNTTSINPGITTGP